MKLKWLEFENLRTGLKVERIHFYKDITLLVGLSGVGKTQIIDKIFYSIKLALYKINLEPYHTKIAFEINLDEYVWEYCTQNSCLGEMTSKDGYFILDKLTKNGEILFSRDKKGIYLKDYEKIPTPKRDESLLLQYAEDEKFKDIISEMKKLYAIETDIGVRLGMNNKEFAAFKIQIKDKVEKNIDFELLSYYPTVVKLYIIKHYYERIYEKIFDAVTELFPEIQDIDVVEDVLRELYVISIKVYDKILLQNEISNGMLKTIYYIVELFTMSKNSLVLIDEFENGLGVNCIDLLSDMLIHERKDLQFVITSHHPKIINSITKEKWKILDRNISVITNFDSRDYGIGNSQHDAYFNLLSRWEYEGKI